MQCLNPMQLGPPASKSMGDTLSSIMLINNSGTKLLGSSSETQQSTSSAVSSSVPTYTQSLLDIDCEGGYNVPSLSPSNDIPLITAPSITPSPTVQKEKSIIGLIFDDFYADTHFKKYLCKSHYTCELAIQCVI